MASGCVSDPRILVLGFAVIFFLFYSTAERQLVGAVIKGVEPLYKHTPRRVVVLQ